jgi:tubulin polyglutamylase TTLL6/13
MDSGVTPEILQSLKSYQRINHFPGMYIISRKDYLGKNLNDIKRHLTEEFDFFPDT